MQRALVCPRSMPSEGDQGHTAGIYGPATSTQPPTHAQGHGQVFTSLMQIRSHRCAGGATGDMIPEGGAKFNATSMCCLNAQAGGSLTVSASLALRPEGGQSGQVNPPSFLEEGAARARSGVRWGRLSCC